MRMLPILFLFCTLGAGADPAFWDQAAGLVGEGKVDEAGALAQKVLSTNPDDADALVIAGTAVLYQRMEPRFEDSIFMPEVAGSAAAQPRLGPAGVDAVAAYWKRVPALDPGRSYLWGDLAQLTFRSGDSARAMDYALQVLADQTAEPEALATAASVFALNLDWARAAQALNRIPGERTGLLYQGLEAWRTGKDGWRDPLRAFVANPGSQKAGTALAAYLAGPAMRDTEAGFLEAIRLDDGIGTLAVRQKYVERYPDKFQPRLDLARALCQYGSFVKALVHYGEIDRKAIASGPDQKLTVLFQEAWAHQGAGHRDEAVRLWALLADSKDFYVRSAAAWFLGNDAWAQKKPEEAKAWWTRVADEPARSKYAFWAAAALKK